MRQPLSTTVRLAACSAVVLALEGCASPLVTKSLEMVGLRAPEGSAELAEEARKAAPQPKKVTLRIHAGEQLNTNAEMRSLSVVLRIYKLRRIEAFSAATYASFGNAQSEDKAFGADLVNVREVVLTPGQRHEVVETMPLDAAYLAVVALFRAPAEERWRFVFETGPAAKTGVTLGVHGCALSVAEGVPVGAPPESLRLAGTRCA